MPIGPVGDENVAIRLTRVGDLVDLHARGKNIHDHGVAQRNDARAELLSPNEFIAPWIRREEITLHAHNRSLVAFYSADEMAPDIVCEKLPVNDVDVFAIVKDHKFVELGLG